VNPADNTDRKNEAGRLGHLLRRGRRSNDGLIMEALLHTLRLLTPVAQAMCVVLLVIYLFSGIRSVGPSQSALVLRLGKLQPRVHGPGLLFAWPKPLDEVVLLETGAEHTLVLDAWTPQGPRVEKDKDVKQFTDAETMAYITGEGRGNAPLPVETKIAGNSLDPVTDGYSMTGDWNIVQGRFTLRYRISDPVAWFRAGSQVESMLSKLGYQAAADALSATEIDRALTDEREKLAVTIRDRIQSRAKSLGFGVIVTAFELREIAPPKQVVAAFEDVINAKLYAKTIIENSEEYRTKQLTLTRGQTAVFRQRAEAYADKLVASAEGEAEAFRLFEAEYAKNPALVGNRIYTETLGYLMRRVNSTAMLPAGAPAPNVLLEPSPDNSR
jgi:modulator of FtsH protease HflK